VGDESHVRAPKARALTALLVGRSERELEPRVAGYEGAELATGIPARAEDSNRDSMHAECILLHTVSVNRSGSAGARSGERRAVSCRSTALSGIVPSTHGGTWVDKRKRQSAILDLVERQPIGSQEELRVLLHKRGWDVTQSTLSRDLRELRLARVPTSDGVRYAVADGTLSSAARPALDALLPQLLTRVDGVGEMIVVRTVPGGAQPVASALDGESWPDVLGTVGGDDTILVVCRSSTARERLERRLRKLAEI